MTKKYAYQLHSIAAAIATATVVVMVAVFVVVVVVVIRLNICLCDCFRYFLLPSTWEITYFTLQKVAHTYAVHKIYAIHY